MKVLKDGFEYDGKQYDSLSSGVNYPGTADPSGVPDEQAHPVVNTAGKNLDANITGSDEEDTI